MHESYSDSKFRVDPGAMFLLESSARRIPCSSALINDEFNSFAQETRHPHHFEDMSAASIRIIGRLKSLSLIL